MLTPYPQEFKEAALVVIDKLRGKAVETKDAVHAGWCLAGFAISQTLGGGPQPVGAFPQDDEGKAAFLETNLVHSQGLGLIPWQSILTMILDLIQGWLSGKGA